MLQVQKQVKTASRAIRLNSAALLKASMSSTPGSSLVVDPATLVSGLTHEQLESDPALQDYLKANFPKAFQSNTAGEALEEEFDEDKAIVAAPATEKYPRNIRPISTYLRQAGHEEGSRPGRRLRYLKMIPGVVYGSDPTKGILSNEPFSKILVKTPWRILEKELDRYHHSFESRVYDLTVYRDESDTEGNVHRVVPKNVQRHPVLSSIYCANFLRYHPGRPLHLPITYTNTEESPALKREGFVVPIKRTIECYVEDGANIAEQLELDCSGLRLKDVMRLDRISLPDGVRFSNRTLSRGDDFILGVVLGRGRDMVDTTQDT